MLVHFINPWNWYVYVAIARIDNVLLDYNKSVGGGDSVMQEICNKNWFSVYLFCIVDDCMRQCGVSFAKILIIKIDFEFGYWLCYSLRYITPLPDRHSTLLLLLFPLDHITSSKEFDVILSWPNLHFLQMNMLLDFFF